MTVDVTDPGTSGPPEHLRTARTLWWGAAGFAVLGNLLVAVVGDMRAIARLQPEALKGIDAATLDSAVVAAKVLAVVVFLGLAALTAWLAHRMTRGARWARMLLDVGGFLLVWNGAGAALGVVVPSLAADGGGPVPGFDAGSPVAFVVVCSLALAGLCAGVAVWRQHSADSDEFLGTARVRP